MSITKRYFFKKSVTRIVGMDGRPGTGQEILTGTGIEFN